MVWLTKSKSLPFRCLVITTVLLLIFFNTSAVAMKGNDSFCDVHRQKIEAIDQEIQQLEQFATEGKDKLATLKKAHDEILKFSSDIRLETKKNVIKAYTAAMISLLTEAAGFVSSGATVDVIKWIAGKVGSEAMGRSKIFSGPSYYQKHLTDLQAATKDLAPKLAEFNRLRALPLDSFKISEKGEVMGDTGAILKRGRLLARAADQAYPALYMAYVRLRALVENSGNEIKALRIKKTVEETQLSICERIQKKKPEQAAPAPAITATFEAFRPTVSPVSGRGGIGHQRKCAAYSSALQGLVAESLPIIRDIKTKSDKLETILSDRYKEFHKQAVVVEKENLSRLLDALHPFPRHLDIGGSPHGLSSIMDGIYPVDIPFQKLLEQTRSFHEAGNSAELKNIEHSKAFANEIPATAADLGVEALANDLLSVEAKLRALEVSYRQIAQECNASSCCSLSIDESDLPTAIAPIGVVDRINFILRDLSRLRADILRKAARDKQNMTAFNTVFKTNEPLARSYFAEVVAEAKNDTNERLDKFEAAKGPVNEFIDAVDALSMEYKSLLGKGILTSYKQGDGGVVYTINQEWIDKLLPESLFRQGYCPAFVKLRDNARPLVWRLDTLRQSVDSQRGVAQMIPGLGSSQLLTSNAPEVAARLKTAQDEANKLESQVQEATTWLGSHQHVLRLVSELEEGHFIRGAAPPDSSYERLAQGMSKRSRGLQNLLKVLTAEATNAAARSHLLSGEAARLGKALDDYYADYKRNLACLGKDNDLVKPITKLLAKARKAVGALSGKPSYADAGYLIGQLVSLLDQVKQITSDDPQFAAHVDGYNKQHDAFAKQLAGSTNFSPSDLSTMNGLLAKIGQNIPSVGIIETTGSKTLNDANRAAVNHLYQQFAAAYENHDVDSVIALLEPDWQATDGSNISDLELSLSNSFNVFDGLTYQQQGLQITSIGKGDFDVQYNLGITGVILDQDLTHEEKSHVEEKVHCDTNGNCLIVRTIGGHFDMVK